MKFGNIEWIKSIKSYTPSAEVQSFAASFICYVVVVLIIAFFIFPKQELKERIGQVSRKDYTAPYDIEFVNSERTEQARSQAAEKIQPIRRVSESLNGEYISLLEEFELFLRTVQDSSDERSNLAFTELNQKSYWPKLEAAGFNINDLKSILALDVTQKEEYLQKLEQVQSTVLRGAITEERIELYRNQARNAIQQTIQNFSPSVSEKIIFAFIGPNSEIDAEATQKLKEANASRIPEVKEKVFKDEIYLRKGEVINQRHIDILKAQYGTETKKEARTRLKKLITMSLLTLAGFLLFSYFMGKIASNPLKDTRIYYLFLSQTIVTILIGVIMSKVLPPEGLQYLLLVPLLTNSWIITYFISIETSLFSTLLQGAFLALSLNLDRSFLLSTMMIGAVSSFLIRRDCRRVDILRGMILIILIGSLTITAVNLIFDEPLKTIPRYLLLNLFACVGASILMLWLAEFYVWAFNIITRYHLNDLSDINNALIKQLRRNAPGSYHHSLIVGDLAEIAAESIGANGLLARVATLYHDIGKAKMPHFFIENQAGRENPHDRYPPSLSRLVMLSHVKDGVQIAKKSRLPKEITDAIQQHHGTTLMTYFFNKAVAQSDGKPVDEFDFRYEGPKPQYPEMAIIALADSSESAVRSLDEPTPHRIETTVNTIFKQRLLDGQYDESGLSISQLEKIKESIIETLSGIYHSRIEYPDVQELKSRLEKQEKEQSSAEKEQTPSSPKKETGGISSG